MLTVEAASTDYLASLQARHVPVATVKADAGDVRRFAAGVPSKLGAVDAAAIRAFLDGEQDRSPATRRRRHGTLCSFFRWLVQQELIDLNLVASASARTASSRTRGLESWGLPDA
ncbi:MAG: hypothetical protein JF888_07710 [Candidatus Dormibacteraeota bacterium]|uniref:Core-binding (CB) domain-containing protein n=2 Tax=Candidatus Dormiibacter inghamiae TaxID=3127013 RepID=A0A934KCR5_9BACT|nr:hypothetical protein [Candidatus Dormibacteraeota bacterium]MBJ7606007.1 hypothetical protein [Candidatus Dormibacteraeota bacterium]